MKVVKITFYVPRSRHMSIIKATSLPGEWADALSALVEIFLDALLPVPRDRFPTLWKCVKRHALKSWEEPGYHIDIFSAHVTESFHEHLRTVFRAYEESEELGDMALEFLVRADWDSLSALRALLEA